MKEESIIKAIYNRGKKAGEHAEKLRTQSFLSKEIVGEFIKLEQDFKADTCNKRDQLTLARLKFIRAKFFKYLQSTGEQSFEESVEVEALKVKSSLGIRIQEKGMAGNISKNAIKQLLVLKQLLRKKNFTCTNNVLLIRYDSSITHIVFKLFNDDSLDIKNFKAEVLLIFNDLRIVNENYYKQGDLHYWHIVIST